MIQRGMSQEHASFLIANMGFSNGKVGSRIRNVLAREGILHLEQLLALTEHNLRKMEGLGAISLAEIKAKLAKMDLKLKDPTW